MITKSGMHATHKGLAFGIVPVYIEMREDGENEIEARNLLGEILFNLVEPLYGILIFIRTCIDDNYEPSFPVKITGKINESNK